MDNCFWIFPNIKNKNYDERRIFCEKINATFLVHQMAFKESFILFLKTIDFLHINTFYYVQHLSNFISVLNNNLIQHNLFLKISFENI